MSSIQEGGSRCKNVLAAQGGTGPSSPPLAHHSKSVCVCGGDASPRVRRCMCACTYVFQCVHVRTGFIFASVPGDLSLTWGLVCASLPTELQEERNPEAFQFAGCLTG